MRRYLPALVVLSALLGVPVAAAQSGDWDQLQGGPERLGDAGAGPAPPYRVAWDAEAGESGHRGASGPVVHGDRAYVVGREEVAAFAIGSGRGLWTVARAPGLPVSPAVSSDGSLLVYPEGTGETAAVVALDLQTRAVRWRYRTDEEVRAAPTSAGDSIYVGTRVGSVVALDAETGDERWSYDAGGVLRAPLAVSDDLVYAVAVDTEAFEISVHALKVADGEREWRFQPERPGLFASGATVAHGRVYVGFGDGAVRALDAATGALRWTRTIELSVGFAPAGTPAALGGDVVVASAGGLVARIGGDTGEELWRFRFPSGFIHGAPVVTADHVLAGRFDGVAVAVDAATGRRAWELDLGGGTIGPFAVAGDLLLAGLVAAEGGLVALEHDPQTELTSVESPSTLHPDRALVGFAIAFAAVTAGIGLGFRLLPRRSLHAPSPRDGTADEAAGPGDEPGPAPTGGGYR